MAADSKIHKEYAKALKYLGYKNRKKIACFYGVLIVLCALFIFVKGAGGICGRFYRPMYLSLSVN